MHNFCNDCPHRLAPKSIREKFNKYVKPLFFDCPITLKKVDGCIIKFIVIDWKEFSQWLKSNSLIDESEEKILKIVGLYEEKDV